MPEKNERLWAVGLYISSFFFVLFGPLIIWLIKKDDSNFVDYHGKEYFNFLLSYTIYLFVSFLLALIMIGILTAWLVGIYAFVFTAVAAFKAYKGEFYHIPLTIRFFK